jgi:hypothetical protein
LLHAANTRGNSLTTATSGRPLARSSATKSSTVGKFFCQAMRTCRHEMRRQIGVGPFGTAHVVSQPPRPHAWCPRMQQEQAAWPHGCKRHLPHAVNTRRQLADQSDVGKAAGAELGDQVFDRRQILLPSHAHLSTDAAPTESGGSQREPPGLPWLPDVAVLFWPDLVSARLTSKVRRPQIWPRSTATSGSHRVAPVVSHRTLQATDRGGAFWNRPCSFATSARWRPHASCPRMQQVQDAWPHGCKRHLPQAAGARRQLADQSDVGKAAGAKLGEQVFDRRQILLPSHAHLSTRDAATDRGGAFWNRQYFRNLRAMGATRLLSVHAASARCLAARVQAALATSGQHEEAAR